MCDYAYMMDRICTPGWDNFKVSENLGANAVVPVAPAVTFLVGFWKISLNQGGRLCPAYYYLPPLRFSDLPRAMQYYMITSPSRNKLMK